jgi:hypothetical protein
LFAAGKPFGVVPPAPVPTPALPATEPNDTALPLQGAPAPAKPELGNWGDETPGEMIVLWPTAGPIGTVGVCGVVKVPCANAGVAESRIAANKSRFIF